VAALLTLFEKYVFLIFRRIKMNSFILLALVLGLVFLGCNPENGTEDDKCTVTFNLDGGNINGNTGSVSIQVDKGGTIDNLPNPQKNNNTFGGFFTGTNGSGNEFTTTTIVNSNMTVFAKWTSTGNGSFVSSTDNAVSNDVSTLGIIGTVVSSSNTGVATVAIVSGKISITSVSQGSAVISVKNASDHTATINVTVSGTGSIAIGTITKWTSNGNNEITLGELAGDWLWYDPSDPTAMGAKISMDANGEFLQYGHSGGVYFLSLKGIISLGSGLDGTLTYTAVWVSGTSSWDSSENALSSVLGSTRSVDFTVNGTSSGSILNLSGYTLKIQ
jgi:hypothetical protein